MIPEQRYVDVIERCVFHNVPFVMFRQPDCDQLHFFASTPDDDTEECRMGLGADDPPGFFINFFGNDESYLAGVKFVYDIDTVEQLLGYMESNDLCFMPTDVVPTLKSTPRITYAGILRNLIPDLRSSGAKLVISQVTVEVSGRLVGAVALDYFRMLPSTFRFLCFTPETGMWLGASPELLVSSDSQSLMTMSLAGTRPATESGPWDAKNLREHDVVTEFITSTLTKLGLTVRTGLLETVQVGPVAHLRNMIKASGRIDPAEVLYSLSPTPALAGYPDRDAAVERIIDLEPHSRYCYGGFVGLKVDDRVDAYVNLRSALITPCECQGRQAYLYNIYSGGGIMGDSDPESEWSEAMRKCSLLREAVNGDPYHRIESLEGLVTFPTVWSRKDFLISTMYEKI